MWFYALCAGSGAWVALSYTFDLRRKLSTPVEVQSQNEEDGEPWGGYGDIRNYAFINSNGRFRSVRETYDELGAKVFLVDYGNGQKVKQHFDPRELQ